MGRVSHVPRMKAFRTYQFWEDKLTTQATATTGIRAQGSLLSVRQLTAPVARDLHKAGACQPVLELRTTQQWATHAQLKQQTIQTAALGGTAQVRRGLVHLTQLTAAPATRDLMRLLANLVMIE